jgi:protein-L-isoaspartate O-methyltransferase
MDFRWKYSNFDILVVTALHPHSVARLAHWLSWLGMVVIIVHDQSSSACIVNHLFSIC